MSESASEMVFDDAFFSKLFRLLRSSKKPEVAEEILRLHDQVLAHYKQKGWTEHWGGDGGEQSTEGSEFERVKHMEKPLAPVKKDSSSGALRPTVIQSPKASPKPSPCPSPKPTSESSLSASTLTPKLSLSESPTSILTTQTSIKVEEPRAMEEETSNKKKRRVVVESSSENDEDEASKRHSSARAEKHLTPKTERAETNKNDLGEEPAKKKKKRTPSPVARDNYCSVCKALSLSPGNTVVQCHECSRLYHQQCHQPPIPSNELNDPRFIFYCSSCKNKINKLAKSNNNSPATSATNKSGQKETKKPVKDVDSSSPSNLFKRNEVKAEGSSLKTFSGSGLATLAADFFAKHKGGKTLQKPPGSGTQSSPGATQKPFSSPGGGSGVGLGRLAQQHGPSLMGLGKLAAVSSSSSSGSGDKLSPTTPAPSQPSKTIQASRTPMQLAEKRLMDMKKKMGKK